MQETNSQTVIENAALESALQLSSEELFRKGKTVRIEHAGQTYWLRLTRGNKLILTK
jgi:hemin uptake protein HemP